MSSEPGYHNRQPVLAENICNLLYSLSPSTYDEIAPKIEYWIECVIAEQFTTVDDLVERVSSVAWEDRGSQSDISRFLKEFRDAPHRSEGTRSFVDGLCLRVLRWFAVASVEDLWNNWAPQHSLVSKRGGPGFIHAASFVGHLIERGLVNQELVRRYLFKPLTTHYYDEVNFSKQSIRANALYKLLTAGNALLQGLLEPEDVQVCFEKFETWITLGKINGLELLDAARLNELRETHAAWLQRKEEEERRNPTATQILVEVETPIAFAPQNLPGIGISSSISKDIEFLSALQDAESSSNIFPNDQIPAASSPTLSIFTVSDLAPTEFDEDIGEGSDGGIPTRHETFYLQDGNIEILCERTIFRVHSPIISFSSSKLRDMLSSSTLLNAPMPEGCPRVVFRECAEDFAVLLKMIYTPVFPGRHKVPEFKTFASLLRMATKYGFPDVRETLVEDLKGAYPTKWEDFETAKVLGENIFGSPKPHPNAVLNLLLEQKIKFALPFAAYRAALGGFSSLISDKPDAVVLPRLTLASTIHGMEKIRHVMVRTSHSIAYSGNLRVCPRRTCVPNVGMDSMERRMEVLKKVFDVMVVQSKGDVLSPVSFGDLVCVNCVKLLEDAHLRFRARVVWEELPSLVGRTWEDV